LTGAVSGELQVTEAKGQTFEKVRTWSVDSQVCVEPKLRATVALMVREEEVDADLTVESVIRALDNIPVYIRCRKSKKLILTCDIPAECLPEILMEGFQKVDQQTVKCETKGSVHLVCGTDQVIRLETEKLECGE
jgi:hypothetical protein